MKDSNIRCPDVSFTLKSRLPQGRPHRGFGEKAPDLCVEIISPSEERADIQRKLWEYFSAGAQRVWHIYSETQTVKVFESLTDFKVVGRGEELNGEGFLPDFRCRVEQLFEME